jgi:predicted ATPase
MIVTYFGLKNWHNFREMNFEIDPVVYFVGLKPFEESHLLDAFLFLHTVAKSESGGLQAALRERGGIKKICGTHGRPDQDIFILMKLADSAKSDAIKWTYELAFKSEGNGKRRVLVAHERVMRDNEELFYRPNDSDILDAKRLTQTFLEKVSENTEFRTIAKFLSSTSYVRRVPQIIRFSDEMPTRVAKSRRKKNEPDFAAMFDL